MSAYLFITYTCAQESRFLPISSRRRLPTVIITREHLRQRPNSYGTYGDTAAEFVVSAGLDTSKNSAVRIRRIGNRHSNVTNNTRFNINMLDFPSSNGTRRVSHVDIPPDQEFRTPSFHNADERNGIPHSRTSNDHRYHSNEGGRNQISNRRQYVDDIEQRVRFPNGGPNPAYNRHQAVPERRFHQYRPPIFVPNYQQNRRSDANSGIPRESIRRVPNVVVDQGQRRHNSNEQIYPIVSVKYSTSSVSATTSQKQHVQPPLSSSSNVDNVNRKFQISNRNNNKPAIPTEAIRRNSQGAVYLPNSDGRFHPKEKPFFRVNNTNDLYVPSNHPSIQSTKLHSEKPDFKENIKLANMNESKAVKANNKMEVEIDKKEDSKKNTTQDVVSRNPVTESANPVKSTETSPTQFNIDRIRDIQTRLIRKPSLILRDQITVNELPKMFTRPRFGPRSLEHSNENHALSRQKRQIQSGDDIELESDQIFTGDKTNAFENTYESLHFSNASDGFKLNTTQRRGRYNSQNFGSQFSLGRTNDTSETLKSTLPVAENESRVAPVYEMFSNGTYGNDEDATSSDIMSFSDFLASPLAEKIRLERQFFFKGGNSSTRNASTETSRIDNRNLDTKSLRNNTMMYLRNLISAKLLESMLGIASNISSNFTQPPTSGRSSDGLASAEQRQIGIMVTPYDDDQESADSHIARRPVIRILKGRIVTLPEIPPELIPIILGTYKPTYTEPEEPPYNDDANLSDNMLDNAIYKLLQNDELLNLQPVIRKPHRPITYKVSRKSPSTNYIGSLKSNEPIPKPKFSFKPSDWTLEPRCDRLTEEICLDDSDYPSSAIMTSIYKDKAKFDLMYAELKVHESQVEGLSRQQETAFSYDHYYGSYPHASGSSYSQRDYGPNGGFVCPSEVHYARPHRAKNRKADWKVVVNVGEYTQTLRMEKCMSSGNPCKYVVNNRQSTCAQVYSYHRLLVFSKEKGLHIDVFRVPTACSCYLRPSLKTYNLNIAATAPYQMRPNNQYEEYGGHVETAPMPHIQAESPNGNSEKKRKTFSNTLWAILGGGQQASTLAQQPQFLDEVQKQITWTQQLKHFPQLMKQISPSQVLKQLLEEEEEDHSIRRQRIRQKQRLDQLAAGGFASHQVPIVVPLPPPPPPPPGAIQRRPVVGMVPVDQKSVFTSPPEGPPKVIAITSSEPTKVFSLTKDPNAVKMRPNGDVGRRKIYILNPQSYNRMKTFKVQPGMYPPQSENFQIPESSLLPVAPQFTAQPHNPMKPVMKPMPAPKGSKKSIVEDEDLVAAEKTVGEGVESYAVGTDEKDGVSQEDGDSKINFSYHPILEYLNV